MTDDLVNALKELHGIVNNFRIRGSGVAGNLATGYTVKPGASQIASGGGGGVPPPGTCPSETTATVTFTGISTSCGCVDLFPNFDTASMEYLTNPFNSVQIVTLSDSGTGWVLYDVQVTDPAFYDVTFTSNSCEDETGQDESGWEIQIACFDETNDQGVDPGKYILILSGPSFQSSAFYSGALPMTSNWMSVSNIVTCEGLLSDSFLTWNGGDRVGSATGGAASITFS